VAGERAAERDPVCVSACSGGKWTLRVGLALHTGELGSLITGKDCCESD
jgi:hypothetical protein